MRELSVAEQRYQAVMAVIGDGLTVSQAAEKTGVARQTLHRWLDRYEAQGLEGLVDRSHRPVSRSWPSTTTRQIRRRRPAHRLHGPSLHCHCGQDDGEIIWSIYDSGIVEDEAHIAIDGHGGGRRFRLTAPAALGDLAAVAGMLADELDTDKDCPASSGVL
jgi:helix-turn-helix protein